MAVPMPTYAAGLLQHHYKKKQTNMHAYTQAHTRTRHMLEPCPEHDCTGWPSMLLPPEELAPCPPPPTAVDDDSNPLAAAEIDAYNDRAMRRALGERALWEDDGVITSNQWKTFSDAALEAPPFLWDGSANRVVDALRRRGPCTQSPSFGMPLLSGVRPLCATLLRSQLLRVLVERAASPQDFASQAPGRWCVPDLARTAVDLTQAAEALADCVVRFRLAHPREAMDGHLAAETVRFEAAQPLAARGGSCPMLVAEQERSVGAAVAKADMRPLARAFRTIGRTAVSASETCHILMRLCCFAYLYDGVSAWMPRRFGLVYLMRLLDRETDRCMSPSDTRLSQRQLASLHQALGATSRAGSKRVLALFWAHLAAEGEAFDAELRVSADGVVDVLHVYGVNGEVEAALMRYAVSHAEDG